VSRIQQSHENSEKSEESEEDDEEYKYLDQKVENIIMEAYSFEAESDKSNEENSSIHAGEEENEVQKKTLKRMKNNGVKNKRMKNKRMKNKRMNKRIKNMKRIPNNIHIKVFFIILAYFLELGFFDCD